MSPKDLVHLRPKTRAWVRQICKEFVLESHHEKVLLVAASSWDRMLEARAKIQAEGLSYQDSKGIWRPHPEIKIEADSQIRFMRAVRELDLDIDEPAASRMPAIRSHRTLASIKGGPHAA
jgi:Phage terminase, small subunit